MRTARQILTKKSLILLYYILTLSFPPNLWHPKPVITKIFKLQKKAICIINGAKYNSHTESLIFWLLLIYNFLQRPFKSSTIWSH